MLWASAAIATLAGALGAGLAQRGAVIYNDGVRALVLEAQAGRQPPRQLAATAFKLSAGLLVGFALPFSLASGLLLVHALWLGSDLIGLWLFDPGAADGKTRPGRAAAALAAGGLYGAALIFALEACNRLALQLPLPLVEARALFGQPVTLTFAALPAIAIAYQHGLRSGLLAFGGILLTRLLAGGLGLPQPENWALGAGLLIVWAAALREPPAPSGAGQPLVAHLERYLPRLRRQWPAAAALGALYGLAAHRAVFAEGPQSLLALAGGMQASLIGAALVISLARALVFTPIKTLSVLASGVFVTDGLGFAWSAGLAAPNPWSAALLGGLAMSLELLALGRIARLLQRFPGLGKAAGHLRTAMTRLLEAALLVGGMLAAESLAPGYGFLLTAGIYTLNEATGTRLLRAGVAPLALLLVWLAANLAAVFG